jgi:hypothetical protein
MMTAHEPQTRQTHLRATLVSLTTLLLAFALSACSATPISIPFGDDGGAAADMGGFPDASAADGAMFPDAAPPPADAASDAATDATGDATGDAVGEGGLGDGAGDGTAADGTAADGTAADGTADGMSDVLIDGVSSSDGAIGG